MFVDVMVVHQVANSVRHETDRAGSPRDHGLMAEDELDRLYGMPPEEFTALRTKLAAAAKQRGDADAANRISAARRPTRAAWVVNRLALRRTDTKQRLADLGDRLRAAHAAMDGDRIRELSAEQHKLIEALARAAFEAADLRKPSPALRDDLTSTLQAAIADPEVRERLGRLAKAERWSGFGAFGEAAPASRAAREATPATKPATKPPRDKEAEAARQQREKQLEKLREKLDAAVAAAERARAEADAALSEREAECAVAQQRRDEARAELRAAERELNNADARYEKAKRASRAAAESVREARKIAKAQRQRPT